MATVRTFGWGFHIQFSHAEVVDIEGAVDATKVIGDLAKDAPVEGEQGAYVKFVGALVSFVAGIVASLLREIDQGNGVYVSMLWFLPGVFVPTTVPPTPMASPPPTVTVDGTGPVIPIQSVQFPSVFLRMDGTSVTAFNGAGAGAVNCQFGAGPFEKYRFVDQGDGTVAIVSVQFPNVCLRVDGTGVTAFNGAGTGTVNCQFGAGAFEKFHLVDQGDGIFSIESVQFPNVFLRMDGAGVAAFNGAGAGTVNCQFGAGPFEKFRIGPM